MLRHVTCALLVLGSLAAFSCGDDSFEEASGTTSSSSTQSGSPATGSSGNVSGLCMPDCVAPQFCSKANVCIDQGTCRVEDDCAAGYECDQATRKCTPGGECGAEELVATQTPPNLLIVLDRSCSMTGGCDGMGNCKWQKAVAAINKLTTTFAGKINFGISLFPDMAGSACGQEGAIPVRPGAGNEGAIQTLLTNALQMGAPYYPEGPCVTNIDTAIEQASMVPELADATRDSYVLFVSDGKQEGAGCTAAAPANDQIVDTLADMFAAGVPTFIVSFPAPPQNPDAVDPAALDAFAVAGGVPRMGMPRYYDVSDPASIDQAFATIAQSTISCDFVLASDPPNPDEIYAFFDDQSVPRDPTHTSGWDYDPATRTVTFYGTSCDTLRSQPATDIDIVFGCNKPA